MGFQQEIAELQSQGMKHALELKGLKAKLDEAKVTEAELSTKQAENAKLLEQAAKHSQELDKLHFMLSQRDSSVLRLREELKKRDMELDSKDEEAALQVFIITFIIRIIIRT